MLSSGWPLSYPTIPDMLTYLSGLFVTGILLARAQCLGDPFFYTRSRSDEHNAVQKALSTISCSL